MSAIVNDVFFHKTYPSNTYERVMQWWCDSWEGILALITAILFVWLIIVPIFSLTETKVRDGVVVTPMHELVRKADQLEWMVKHPMENGDKYFDILHLQADLRELCEVVRILRSDNNSQLEGYYNASHQDDPCVRLNSRIEWDIRNYTPHHQQDLGQEGFQLMRKNYYAQHPERQLYPSSVSKSPTVTIWHPEKLWKSYFGCMTLVPILFFFRIQSKGFHLWWEICTLRFFVMSAIWPYALLYYLTNPAEQMREIKSFIGSLLSVMLSCIGFGARAAEIFDSWKVSTGASVQSSYVYSSAKVANDGWVFQPWVELSHSSGAYIGSWASIGLENTHGNEVDYSLGYRTNLQGIDFDVSYSFYHFMNGWEGMHAPALKACLKEYSLCGKIQIVVPTDGAAYGSQSSIWWTHEWTSYKIGTNIGVVYDCCVYDRKPVAVLKTEVSVPLGESGFRVFGRVLIPMIGGQSDNQDTQALMGLSFAW